MTGDQPHLEEPYLEEMDAAATAYLQARTARSPDPARRMTDDWALALNVCRLVAEVRRLRDLCGRAYDDLIGEYRGATPGSATLPDSLYELGGLFGRDPDSEMVEASRQLDAWLRGDDGSETRAALDAHYEAYPEARPSPEQVAAARRAIFGDDAAPDPGDPGLGPVDIPADFNMVDRSGFVWTFLHEATDPDRIVAHAVVISGDEDEPWPCRVVDLVPGPDGDDDRPPGAAPRRGPGHRLVGRTARRLTRRHSASR